MQVKESAILPTVVNLTSTGETLIVLQVSDPKRLKWFERNLSRMVVVFHP